MSDKSGRTILTFPIFFEVDGSFDGNEGSDVDMRFEVEVVGMFEVDVACTIPEVALTSVLLGPRELGRMESDTNRPSSGKKALPYARLSFSVCSTMGSVRAKPKSSAIK